MDRNKRQGGRRWSHDTDSFDPGKNAPHQQQLNWTESVSNNPGLDQFLSGISIERNNQQRIPTGSGGGSSNNNVTQMGALHQGPPSSGHSLPGFLPPGIQTPAVNPPGALPPSGTMMRTPPNTLPSSSQEWDSYLQGTNKTPNWQVPPPQFAFRNQSQTQDSPMNWQQPANVRQHDLNNPNNSEQRNAASFNRAAGNLLPPSFEQHSANEHPFQEQHNMSREGQHPLPPAQSGQRPQGPPQSETPLSPQLQRNFHRELQVPRLNHPDQQYRQQYQQKQGASPQQPGPHPHQFRPPFGQQGQPEHSDHRPRQPFHPQHRQHQEQYPSGASSHEQDGPHPFRSQPPRPPLQGSSQARPPHPSSGQHPFPRMHQPNHPSPPHFQSPCIPSPDARQQFHPGLVPGSVPRSLPILGQNQQGLPPPPPQPMVEKSQREKDEELLKDWLAKRKIVQSMKTNENAPKANTVNDARQLVVDLIQSLHQLAELKETLSHRIKRDESAWQYECRRVNRMKEKIESLQSRLFDSEFINLLQNKMKKRKKRRERIKKQRQHRYQMVQEAEERRAKLHLKIDAQLAKEMQAQQDLKKEAELQEEIDKTLFEVRKKKQEASQTLDLIKGLRKLRQLRKDAAQVKGVQIPRESDIAFNQRLKPLEELMSKQHDLYREEEKAMQVMLEEEHEEYKEQEKNKLRRRQEEKAVKEMQANMKLIFGKDELVGPDDPRFPFYQFYHQAESNMHALVDIRVQWDQFLVPDTDPEGSSIPVSWVLPSDPSSTAWASVLDT